MNKEEFLKENNIHLYDEIINKVDKDLKEKGLESIYSSIAFMLINKKEEYVKLRYDNVVWYSENDIELLRKEKFINKEEVKEKLNEEIKDLYIENLIQNNLDEEEAKEQTIKQSMINEINKLQEEENKIAFQENRKPKHITSSYFKEFIKWATNNKKELNIITLNLYHHSQVKQTVENYYKLLVASYELAKYLKVKEK